MRRWNNVYLKGERNEVFVLVVEDVLSLSGMLKTWIIRYLHEVWVVDKQNYLMLWEIGRGLMISMVKNNDGNEKRGEDDD